MGWSACTHLSVPLVMICRSDPSGFISQISGAEFVDVLQASAMVCPSGDQAGSHATAKRSEMR